MSITHRFVLGPALLLILALGCSEEPPEPAAVEAPPIPEVTVAEAARLFEAREAIFVDANGTRTRAANGVVPGARLLTSSGRYDPDTELPEDHAAALVFYCANNDCRASDGAAERARQAGFEHVNIMREGIAGWVEAGQQTEPPSS